MMMGIIIIKYYNNILKVIFNSGSTADAATKYRAKGIK